jgi:hypothetical protein
MAHAKSKAQRQKPFKIPRQRNAIAFLAFTRKAGPHQKSSGQRRRAAENALIDELAQLKL